MRILTALRSTCLLGALALGCKSSTLGATPAATDACAGFDWLVGTWRTTDGDTENVERWIRDDAAALHGDSITRAGGQVVYTESLQIVPAAGGFEYRASPQDQPPNVFPMETCGAKWARFTDPAHDWPQSIHYQRTDNTLTATVAGTSEGQERTQTWSWTLVGPESLVSKP